MRPRLPASLRGQTLAVLVATLLVSNLVGITVYWADRSSAVASTEAHDFAERVAGMVTLVHHLPPEWRPDVIREADGRTFHVTLDPAPDSAGPDLDEDLSARLAAFLRSQLEPGVGGDVLVRFTETPFLPRGPAAEAPGAATAEQEQAPLHLHISIAMGAAGWLNFVGPMPRAPRVWLMPATAYILIITLGVGAFAMWLVSRVTAPLTAFADAADRLGRDLRAEPLPEAGPTEVTRVSRAFNTMQARLRRMVENRTEILGALSHDLRTPVTLIRLRAELMAESEEKRKILATAEEMEAMIASVLEFSKVALTSEPPKTVDLAALLASICDDMADAGADVTLQAAARAPYLCRRVALKRAFTNLIDNAVKYGGAARVRLARDGGAVVVEVADDGPGIPQQRHDDVFMPFVRLEGSRDRESGGAGLGLSIAQTIVHAHGGQIQLENRPEGGFVVRVRLP